MYLVTGSTGFVGGSLCRALVARGERVRAFHRPSSNLALLKELDPSLLESAEGDITDLASLRRAMQGVHAVFHAAAMLGTPRHAGEMYSVTVGGTRNLLQAAREAGVQRVVHTSSVAALGVPDRAGDSSSLMDEHHTWNYRPRSWLYGHAKYLAELEVQKAVAQGLDVVIVNPGVILGQGDIHRVSGGIVLHIAQKGIPLAVPGGLNAIHIDDVVRGHLAALARGTAGERTILWGENLTIPRFLELIAEVTGARPSRLILPAGPVRALAGPISLLARLLHLPVSEDLLLKAGNYFYYDTTKMKTELRVTELRTTRDAIEDAYRWFIEGN